MWSRGTPPGPAAFPPSLAPFAGRRRMPRCDRAAQVPSPSARARLTFFRIDPRLKESHRPLLESIREAGRPERSDILCSRRVTRSAAQRAKQLSQLTRERPCGLASRALDASPFSCSAGRAGYGQSVPLPLLIGAVVASCTAQTHSHGQGLGPGQPGRRRRRPSRSGPRPQRPHPSAVTPGPEPPPAAAPPPADPPPLPPLPPAAAPSLRRSRCPPRPHLSRCRSQPAQDQARSRPNPNRPSELGLLTARRTPPLSTGSAAAPQ